MIRPDPPGVVRRFGLYSVKASENPSLPSHRFIVAKGRKVLAYVDTESHGNIVAAALRWSELIEEIGENLSEEIVALNVDLFSMIRGENLRRK